MSAPKRIQMTRQKPWRDDNPDAIVVDRRSRWGNWYKVVRIGSLYQLQKYRDALPDPKAWVVIQVDKRGHRTGSQWGGFTDKADATRFAVEMHARSLRATRLDLDGLHHHKYYLGELRGHDLACWCPLEDAAGLRMPCHADVLLELANPEVVFPWAK